MKNIKNNIFKACNAFLALLIGFLGYSCGDEGDDPVVEYGTPHAKFIVKGKVLASETNQGIKNIRVIMAGDTTNTDGEGNYQVVDEHGSTIGGKYRIEVQDVDGALNGEFENKDSEVEFKDPKFTGGDGRWHIGEVSKELDIELNEK